MYYNKDRRVFIGIFILYRVNKTSGIFWLTQAFTKLHALRLQGENLLFEENNQNIPEYYCCLIFG